jgi:hypothetical protein
MGSDPAEGVVSLGIAAGAFTRTIREVIRDGGQSMCVREIAEVPARRGGRPLDKREFGRPWISSLPYQTVRRTVPMAHLFGVLLTAHRKRVGGGHRSSGP